MPDGGDTALGSKKVSDLQSDIRIEDNVVKGTLNWLTDFTDFDSNDATGNYLCLKINEAVGQPEGTVKFQLKGTKVKQKVPKNITDDGIIICLIHDNDNVIELAGDNMSTKILKCSGLELKKG